MNFFEMSEGERYLLRAPQQNVRKLFVACKKSGTTRVWYVVTSQDGGQDSHKTLPDLSNKS